MEILQIIIIGMIGAAIQLWQIALLLVILGLILNPLIALVMNVIKNVLKNIKIGGNNNEND